MKKYVETLLLGILVISAAYGLVTIAKFIGYAYLATHAGTVTEVNLEFTESQPYYAGVAGVAVRFPGFTTTPSIELRGNTIDKENLLFDCIASSDPREVYASATPPSQLDLSSVTAATPEEVDAYLGINSTSIVSATNTYKETFTIQLGAQSITAPGTRTYTTNLEKSNFTTVLLKDANGKLFFASILTNLTTCFDTSVCNYQFLLPIRNGTNETYYFFPDPNDNCPEGEVGTQLLGKVVGNVTDSSGNPLENVIIEVAGYTTLSDKQGRYNLTTVSGTHNLFAIKEGFQTYKSNVTVIAGNTTTHNIVMVAEVTPNPFTGPGVGPGQDAPGTKTQEGVGPGQGPGESPIAPIIEQPKKIEGTDYVISLLDLKRRIRKGSFLQEVIRFFSFKDHVATVYLEVNGSVKDLITLDKEKLLVNPDGSEEATITIFGKGDVGTYNGTLIITGDMNATIPIEIEVLPQQKVPVEALLLEIETSRKDYYPGDSVKLKTDLRNMLTDQSYPVSLLFTVQDDKGERTVWSYSTNVFLKTSFTVIKSFKLPKDLEAGDYVLRVTARYLGLASGASTIFKVNVPFLQRMLFGKLPVWAAILILIGLATLGGVAFYVKKRIEAKKRYHLRVDYKTLPKPGARSIYVGKIAESDHKVYFNLENFKTHTIVAGSTGGGKSVSAQVIVEEALKKGVAVLVFDPTAQWTGMLRKCTDKTMLSLYSFFGMKKSEAQAFNGNIKEITDAREVIDVMKYAKPGEVQVFACHKLDPRDMDVVVANAIRQFFHANLQESKPLKMLVVFDEVHRLLPKFGGSGEGFLQIERACREFRKWGIGVMLISQVLSDFVGTIKANINTEIQMRTRDEGDLERIRQKYGEDVLRSLVKATVGTGMVENPAYNHGQPFFVAFRPLLHSTQRLSDEEIEKYHLYNEKIEELEYNLQLLEEKGVDVFDLKLELKLALDKVKTGSFNVVDVYLESLEPRVRKEWEKLGEEPKKLEKKLISMEELRKEFEAAKKEREKYEKEMEKEGKKEEEVPPWKKDVPPDKLLKLVNGMLVINEKSLYDEIYAMSDEDFAKHVNEEKNDFADWLEDAVKDLELAQHFRATTDKAKMLELLQTRLEGKPLPKLTPEEEKKLKELSAFKALGGEASEESSPTRGEEAKSKTEEVATPQTIDEAVQPVVGSEEREVGEDKVEASKPQTLEEMSSSTPTPQEGGEGLEELVTNDPSKYFHLANGKDLRSVKELKEYLKEMPDEVFKRHVGEDYNHFADWIEGVFHQKELADQIRRLKDKNEMAEAL